MQAKVLEIRDIDTYIPVIAVCVGDAPEGELYHFKRCGYGPRDVLVTKISSQETECDPQGWDLSRTMQTAHQYLIDHWDRIYSGDVVDVEYILGKRAEPKEPEMQACLW